MSSKVATSLSLQSDKGHVQVDIKWLIAGRLLLLSLILLAATIDSTFFSLALSHQAAQFNKVLTIFLGFAAISAWWIRKRPTTRTFVALQFTLDLLLCTAVVYATGGPVSPFLFLYLPLVMAVALLMSRAAALIFSALAIAVYTTVAVGLLSNWLTPINTNIAIAPPTGGLLLQVVGLLSGMILIAIATSFLRSQLARSYELAEISQRNLDSRVQQQQAIMDTLQDGVVTVGLDLNIQLVNQAAISTFNLRSSELVGKSFVAFLQKLDPQFKLNDFDIFKPYEARDLELKVAESSEIIKLRYQGNPVFDALGIQSGMIFTFEDLTKLRSIEEQLQMQERLAQLLAAKDVDLSKAQTKLKNFVGESPVMQKIFGLIERVAKSDATVLITGESGTGKELVAKAIHLESERANSPFIPVNCGAIPENLLESELFGHKRGAYTGAESDALGIFRSAEGGTIFLDEIGELPMHMQTKLLRALQDRKVRPVGGDRDIPINVRVITATNRNLRHEVSQSKFRGDLYYRLNVVNIQLPPLRERKQDIPLLVNSILRSLTKGSKVPLLPPATMSVLLNYQYPGNVRELENILERALVLGGEAILPENLPDNVRELLPEQVKLDTKIIIDESISFPVSLDEILAKTERHYLEAALLKTKGAKKKAADILGMNFRSFRYRLQKYGIGGEDSLDSTD